MELRDIALATTALVAIAALATPASAGGYMGKINLSGGFAWENYDYGSEGSSDNNYSTMHGSGSVNVPYNDRVNLQFDIFGAESLDNQGGESGNSFYGGFGAGAHINYRDPAMGALGVFAAVGRANGSSSWATDTVVFAAGLEGEYYCNAWTLRAQAGYLDSDSNGGYLVQQAGFVLAGANYYASKKLKLSGEVGYLDGATSATDAASDVTEWNWAFTIEYMFGQSVPVSTYLEYRGQASETYDSPSYDVDRHALNVGVRFYFGGDGDLQKADREGAGSSSPDILTWSRRNTD